MNTLSRSLVLLASLSACGNPESKIEAPVVAAHAPAIAKKPEPALAAAPEAPPPSPDALPIPEDFEAEAETTITKASYKKALLSVAREIENDAKADPVPK